MSTQLHISPEQDERRATPLDYAAAEGIEVSRERREWTLVWVALAALVSVLAVIVAVAALARSSGNDAKPVMAAPAAAETDAAPTLAQANGIPFESFKPVDATLPAPVTKVDVDVFQHVTQVSKDLAPTEVWSFAVNGRYYRGTGVSAPIVVVEGTKVRFSITNGMNKSMKVDVPHSLDFHSAEVNPGARYADLAPGKKMSYTFDAKHPGVFMYHCATQPVLMHTGAGMVGMMIVKPKNLPPVDKELWITQQEYYVGKPGQDADMAKMQAKQPDVIAFNGFANQYKDNPITVRKDEKVRIYVLNAGPSVWSAFHVIGTVFDRTVVEGQIGRHAQTINLAPSQGGWVEFTLDAEGTYPFVTHGFGDMVKGALGVLATPNAPNAAGHDAEPAAGPEKKVTSAAHTGKVTLGEMWIRSDATSIKAGEVTFNVTNEGATMHGLAIVKAPADASGGILDDNSFIAKGKDLMAGDSETLKAKLEPGDYELVCYVAGHYTAGQKLAFKVT